MPRLLPRLIHAIEKARAAGVPLVAADRPYPKPKRNPPVCSTRKTSIPFSRLLSHRNRTRSVLLEDVNPISHRAAFEQHKTRAPSVRKAFAEEMSKSTPGEQRAMTREERGWWASPYLRMLSSPIRRCTFSNTYHPTDFLIRLAVMRIPSPRNESTARTIFPDGLEHPRFRSRKSGFGQYILCSREVVEHMLTQPHIYGRFLSGGVTNSRLAQQIGYLLRVRVLQELELLADELQSCSQYNTSTSVLRRLTGEEWREIKETGMVTHEGALAVLVVPPPNKNLLTKQRPEPSTSSIPLNDEETNPSVSAKDRPMSVLLSAMKLPPDQDDNWSQDMQNSLTRARVPLYHCVSVFPSRSQRAALHVALNRLLKIERRSRMRSQMHVSRESPEDENKAAERLKTSHGPTNEENKGSHAYLLSSTSETLSRGDSAPLALALWRLRMWEGQSWSGKSP